MKITETLRKGLIALFLVVAVNANFLSVAAQDVVVSSDFSGSSSAFVFRTARKPAQRKVAYRTASSVTRTKTAKLNSLRRVTKQSVSVAKLNPKRQKSKEVNPSVTKIDEVAMKRKTPQEASVIFAGVGEFYLAQDNIDEAVNWFRESVQLDAKNAKAKSGLSDALTRKGDVVLGREAYDVARLIYAEALEFNPKNAGAQAGLAEVFAAKDDLPNAILAYEKAIATDADLTELNAPLGVLYYQKGEIAKAEIYLQKALAVDPENAETQFFVGLLRFKQDRFTDALTAFKRSAELDPANPEVYYYLGETYDQLNNDKDAVTAYKKAVELNPRYLEAWFDLGVAYFNRDKLPEAVDAYKKALTIKPTYGEAHANLADVYRLLDKVDESISEYRLATTFIKDDAELYSKFGYMAARRAVSPGYQNYWRTAIENFEAAIRLKPDYVDYSNLGWAYYNLAQIELRDRKEESYKANLPKARAALLKAIELKPVPKVAAAVNLNLGMTLIDLGDYAGAIAALKIATELEPKWLPAMNELGLAYRKNGDLENAVKMFKKAIDADKNFASAIYNLAESEFRRGNVKEARKNYDRLIALKADNLAKLLIINTNGGILK